MDDINIYQISRKATRKLYVKISKMFQYFVQKFQSIMIKSSSVDSELMANVLVVKRPVYVEVAKVCIESFCYFNSQYNVIVHVDSHTEQLVCKRFKNLIRKQRVKVVTVSNQNDTWQIQKTDLICSLAGSKSIFMDADLKWNGPLPKFSGITFFVNEFLLDQHSDYNSVLRKIFGNKDNLGGMKNTSFFSWDGIDLSSAQKKRIKEIEHAISVFASSQSQTEFSDQLSNLKRMSEQLALSLFVEEIQGVKLNYLKSKDGFKDGAFVESSYFGATGARF